MKATRRQRGVPLASLISTARGRPQWLTVDPASRQWSPFDSPECEILLGPRRSRLRQRTPGGNAKGGHAIHRKVPRGAVRTRRSCCRRRELAYLRNSCTISSIARMIPPCKRIASQKASVRISRLTESRSSEYLARLRLPVVNSTRRILSAGHLAGSRPQRSSSDFCLLSLDFFSTRRLFPWICTT